ncbi:MAG: D-3-phosphoglycerate dehydrogenase [Deltaproteobacteria bacterium]|nr:D-3-phosphoglycerate dehydrogenase [Deltaproteobacteria bacterium]
MRILIADKLSTKPLEELEVLGLKIDYRPDLDTDALVSALTDVNILVVRSTRVTRAAIEAAPALNLIVRAGAGVNTIDVDAASDRGIYVSNCPGKNGAAVAELVMGLVLALDRKLVDATVALREGRWSKAEFSDAPGLRGRRMGIAGFGAIGRLVAERALAFGMPVSAWSRSLGAARARELGVHHAGSLLELARTSDVLSLHLPATGATRGIVERAVLEALPDGAIVINTSRAELLDYAALADVAKAKRLRIGLDVFDDEPAKGQADHRPAILDAGLVYGTPHIGASTEEAQAAIAAEVARIVRCFLTEEELPNVVNICKTTPARYCLVLRARDRVGVLANVASVIKRHGLNIEEVHNTVFQGAVAACTKLRLSGRPTEDCLQEIRAFEEVLHVDVIPLPNLA